MKLSNLLKKQKHLKKSKAFTLVELIVVITILAILSTIAFIALQGYTQNSRDSKRISDINSIQKSLEIYIAEKGTYPIPDNYENITYSGATAWIEGTVGDKVIRNLDKINKKPLDPLTGNEYTYSVTSGKTEYQIGAISEGGQMGYKLPINQTHASSKKEAKAMIRGNYNERFLKVQSGTLNWILALPSIIATDITTPEIQTILDEEKLVYNNYSNIPHSYNDYGYTMTGGFEYTNPNPLIYSGSTKTLAEDNEEKIAFVDSLKDAYNGTILQGEPNYQDIVNADTTGNQTGAINLINNFINTNVGGLKSGNFTLPITETPQTPTIYNCTGTLIKANATITNSTGLTSTTNYQTTTPENKCYYLCNNGYIGDDCETLITYTVTFDARGGTGNTPTTKTIDYNTAAGTLPTPPTKVGYIFNGWFTEITGGTELLESTIINSNITYYAQWTANTYTVTFDANSGSLGTTNVTATYDSAMPTFATAPTRTGFAFNGYFSAQTGGTRYYNADRTSAITYTLTTATTLYAQWIANNNTVTFNGNGSNGGSTATQTIATAATANLTANGYTKTGYGFAGWSITSTGGVNYPNGASYTMGASSVNLYAVWTANTYTVSFDANSGSLGTTSVTATYNSAMPTFATAPTRIGYTFNGYFSAQTGGTRYYNADRTSAITYTLTTTTTLYAQWTANNNTVTFNGNGSNGGSTATQTIATAATANLTANGFTKTGYSFNGWSTTSTGGVNYPNGASYTMGTSSVNLYAVWIVNLYTSCTSTGQILSASSTYTGCNSADIIICSGVGVGYILAACNVGTSTSGTGATSYGYYIQFGKSDSSWVNGNASYNYDWKSPGGVNAGSANDWGILEANKTTATWLNSDATSRTKMQGPCISGYHVPTQLEWVNIVTAGGWGTNGTNMMNTLKLPYAGYRHWNGGSITNTINYGYIWSSSPYDSQGGQLYYLSNGIYAAGSQLRSNGLPIRCLKN